MKLNQIRDVVAVAERGSLRSAARQLGIAQPSITRSIRELEHELGAVLFERVSTGMALTPMGEAFVRRANAIQLEMQRAQDEVRQLRGTATGTASVVLSTAAQVALLPRVLAPFARHFPEVRLKVAEGLFPSVEADLNAGTVDFYVGPMLEQSGAGGLLIEKLMENTRIVAGRPGHPLAGARSMRDLVGASWAVASIFPSSDSDLEHVFGNLGLPAPRVALEARTSLSLTLAVYSTDYLCLLPRQWLDFAMSAGVLQHIPVRETVAASPVCIVRRARLPLTPVAEYLCDLFRRAAGHYLQEEARAAFARSA